MNIHDATEQAYKNGYETGFKEGYEGGFDVGKRHGMASVTHCKDCAHSDTIDCSDGMVWCGRMCRYMKEDGFCSFGERRNDG